MDGFWSTIYGFLIVFGLVVLFHEFGHFLAAKLAGVKVEEFGFGYPPRLLVLFRKGGTEYTLNLLPLGGFVRLKGENGDGEQDPDSLYAQSAKKRAAIFVAGSVMNIVLAWLTFTGVYLIGWDQPVKGSVAIVDVAAGSPAEQAGLQVDDRIVAVNGKPVDTLEAVTEETQAHLGEQVTLTIRRGDQELEVQLVPRKDPPPGEGAMGVGIALVDPTEVEHVHYPLWKATLESVRTTFSLLIALVVGFVAMIGGLISPQIGGPISIARAAGEMARSGFVNLMWFTGFLSANLALLNMVPFPGLDGGRLFFILLEKLRGGRRIAPEYEGLINMIGIFVLIGLMMVVSYFDVVRWMNGSSLVP